jgi:hypothetical protein
VQDQFRDNLAYAIHMRDGLPLFFGEQTERSYELFSMIMTASPIAPPDLWRGCLSGIYVKDGKKQIAVNIAVVLAFARRPVTDWRREMGER